MVMAMKKGAIGTLQIIVIIVVLGIIFSGAILLATNSIKGNSTAVTGVEDEYITIPLN